MRVFRLRVRHSVVSVDSNFVSTEASHKGKERGRFCFRLGLGDSCQVASEHSSSHTDLPLGRGWHEKAFLNAGTSA